MKAMVDTMSAVELQKIESNIKVSQKIIDMGNALDRLRNNKDFKKVIIEGYFEKEAIRLVHLKADINMQSADKQSSIIRDMDAIGALSEYLRTLDIQSQMAERNMASDEATREELLVEELQ